MLGLAGCLALTLWSILSFQVAPAYYGHGKMIIFIGGGVLIQNAPENIEPGFRMADANVPGKGMLARIRGWFMFPQGMGGGSLFIPFGSVVTLFTVLFWLIHKRARERPPAGHCAACGYDLTGFAHTFCPECGAALIPRALP